jgi:hypothetical protein
MRVPAANLHDLEGPRARDPDRGRKPGDLGHQRFRVLAIPEFVDELHAQFLTTR